MAMGKESHGKTLFQRAAEILPQASSPSLERRSEFAGIVIFSAAVGLALALWTFSPADMELVHASQGSSEALSNAVGPVGARIAEHLLHLLGVGAWGLDALLFTLAGRTVLGRSIAPRLHVAVGSLGVLLGGLTLVHLVARALMVRPWGKDAAGLVGSGIAELLRVFLSTAGTTLVGLVLLTSSLSALSGRPLFRIAAQWFAGHVSRWGQRSAADLRQRGGSAWQSFADARAEKRAEKAAEAERIAAERAAEAEIAEQLADDAAGEAVAEAPAPLAVPVRETEAGEVVIDFGARPATSLLRARTTPRKAEGSDDARPAEQIVRLPDTRPSSIRPQPAVDVAAASFPAGRTLAPSPDLLPPSRTRPRIGVEAENGATETPEAPAEARNYPSIAGRSSFSLIAEPEVEASAATSGIRSAVEADDALPADAIVAAEAGLVDDATPPPVPGLAAAAPAFTVVTDDDELEAGPTSVDAVPNLREALAAARANGPRIVETEAMRGNTPAAVATKPAAQGALDIGDRKDWRLPPHTLVQPPPERSVSAPYDILVDNARILEQKLADFKIAGEVTDIRPGPVVTTYEYKPAAGVKISRIAGLKDDLTMSLAALRVRVVAPIPGRDVVGIEVPNKSRQVVYFREILDSKVYADASSKLTIVLGKDIEGGPVVTDLAKAPHLLVAGATGTGKSVGINSFLASLLFRATPEDVKLLLIDPKVLELSVYEGIPHLMLPVIDDPHQAELALKWACREMDRRYHVLADVQVRNLAGYKAKLPEIREKARRSKVAVRNGETVWVDASEPGADMLPAAPEPEDMPYIVIVIDEFADLIMASGKEVERAVARLAQKARAAGIHVILATQRPSTDVITGMIKANFPTRISFQVASSIDSKVVLNSVGAESLLGMGDLLFVPPGSSHIRRCHGTWITDDEVNRLAKHWADQGAPTYDMSILADPEAEAAEIPDDEELDALFNEAVRVSVEADQASVSFLQRKLGIGYGRAARIVDHMEARGIVGPSRGPNKPREIMGGADLF